MKPPWGSCALALAELEAMNMSGRERRSPPARSYGNALASWAPSMAISSCWTPTWRAPPRPAIFQKAFPDRHFDCGIAEADMIGVARRVCPPMGLCAVLRPRLPCSPRDAPLSRCATPWAIPHLNVKIGATHGGISVGEDGASHQCCEDFALMRTIPGMVVHLPRRTTWRRAPPSRRPTPTTARCTCASAALAMSGVPR